MSNQLDNLKAWEERYSNLYNAAMLKEHLSRLADDMGSADKWRQRAEGYKVTLEGIRAQIQEIEGS